MDANAMMKEMMAGPFGGASSTPTRKPMEDALKEHLTLKVGRTPQRTPAGPCV